MTAKEVRRVRANSVKDDSGWTPLQPKYREQDTPLVKKLDNFDEATGSDFGQLMGSTRRANRFVSDGGPEPIPGAYKALCGFVIVAVLAILTLQYFGVLTQ